KRKKVKGKREGSYLTFTFYLFPFALSLMLSCPLKSLLPLFMNKSWRQRIQAHKRDVLIGLAIFVVMSLAFLASRVHQVGDSRYSMLLSQSLLEHGSFTLDRYQIPGVERTESG